MTDHTLDLIFVCWGNICRSPMAEQVARAALVDAGLADRVRVDSAATSTEELGAPIDPRAAATLERAGYHPGDHRAHQIDATELAEADLVIAMEPLHLDRLARIAGSDTARDAGDRVHLLSEYDPAAAPGSGVPDPWYGPDSAFDDTLAAVEAAMPGVLAAIRARLDS